MSEFFKTIKSYVSVVKIILFCVTALFSIMIANKNQWSAHQSTDILMNQSHHVLAYNASSVRNNSGYCYFSPTLSRLGDNCGWAPSLTIEKKLLLNLSEIYGEYMELKFFQPMYIKEIHLLGRDPQTIPNLISNPMVKTQCAEYYKIKYMTEDGFSVLQNKLCNCEKFLGCGSENIDPLEIVENSNFSPIFTKAIRIYPLNQKQVPCIRVRILAAIASGEIVDINDRKYVESYHASSVQPEFYYGAIKCDFNPQYSKFTDPCCWHPNLYASSRDREKIKQTHGEFIEVQFKTPVLVEEVITAGRNPNTIEKAVRAELSMQGLEYYEIHYWLEDRFIPLLNKITNLSSFLGMNSADISEPVKNNYFDPFKTSKIRIYPKNEKYYPCFRFGIIGSTEKTMIEKAGMFFSKIHEFVSSLVKNLA